MRRFWAVLWLAVAACSDNATAPPSARVASIWLPDTALELQIGQTDSLVAVARDAKGTKLSDSVSWSSSNSAVATVSATGLVKGISAGDVTITARAGGQHADVKATVFVIGHYDCTAATTTTLNLPVGGVQVLSAPQALGCLQLAASTSPVDYVFIAANAGAVPDIRESYTIASSTSAQAANIASSVAGVARYGMAAAPTPGLFSIDDATFENPAEGRLRLAERRLRIEGARESLMAAAARSQVRTSVVGGASAAVVPNVGDLLTFRVPKRIGDACTDYDSLRAVVKAVGSKGILVQDTAALSATSGGFADADFAAISSEFDNLIYPTDTSYFGSPSDLDGNQHVIILFTPRVNAYTKSGSSGYTAGFFFGGDLFPRTGTNKDEVCKESNEGEIFYMIAPDPTGRFGQGWPATNGSGFAHPLAQVRQVARGTVAHEFQHMINLGRRIADRTAIGFESTWLDEGLAHFAEDVVGRAERGFGDLQNLTISDVTVNRNDFEAFFAQNLVRFQTWMQRPDASAATSELAASELSYRGAAWALLRYTADQYSGGDVRAFTRKLVGGPDTSVANLTSRAGVPFDSLMVGWMVANYADDLVGLSGLSPKYTYLSYNMRSVMAGVSSGVYPLQVLPLPTSPQALALRSATGVYYRLAASSTPSVLFQVLGVGGARLVKTPGARMYVLRLR